MTELKTDDNYDVASFFQKQFIEANEVSHDGRVRVEIKRVCFVVSTNRIGILTRLSWMFSKISMRLGFPDLPSFK